MAKGAISFDMVADAMKTATSEGGQFFNAMETQSQTVEGRLSTLKDNAVALFGEMSESASEILADDILPRAIELIEWLNEKLKDGTLEKYFKGGAVTAATFGGAIGAMNLALLVKDLAKVKKGMESYTAATKLGTTAQKLLNAELFKSPWTWVIMALAAVVAGIAAYDLVTESSAEKTKNAAEEQRKAIEDIITAYDEKIEEIEKTEEAEKAEAEQALLLKDRLYELEEQIKSGTLTDKEAETAKNDFAAAAKQLEAIIPGITQYLYDETGAIDIQKSSVDALASSYYDLAVAKATAKAFEEKFNAAVEKRINLEEKYNKELTDLTKKSDLIWILEAYNARDTEKFNKLSSDYREKYGEKVPIEGSNLPELREQLSDEMASNTETKKKLEKAEKDQENIWNSWQETQGELEEQIQKYTDAGGKTETTTGTSTGGTTKSTGGTSSSSKTIKTLSDFEKAIKDLEYQQKAGLISEENYFKERKRLRDTYIEEDSEEWQKHTLELNSAYKKWYDQERADLDYKYKMGIIGEQEYYSELATLRDEFLNEDSEDWRKYTKELYDYISEKKEEILNKWKDTADSLKAPNKAFQTLTFHTGEGTETYTTLADLTSENNKLQQYSTLLDKYKERTSGDIPDLVASQLKDMSADDAIKYLTALLNSSDEEFAKQMEDINRNSELAEGISATLLGDEAEELKKSFEESFGTLPPEFFDFGTESGEEFGKGFEEALDDTLKGISLHIASELSNAIPDVIIEITPNHSGGNTYNDNRSTVVNVPENSPRATVEAVRTTQQYQAHTSQYGG